MKIGTILTLKKHSMGNDPGTKGIVFENYNTGVQVIFPNGEYCGYDADECKEYFEDGRRESDLEYSFKNVMRLSIDFENGVFDKYF